MSRPHPDLLRAIQASLRAFVYGKRAEHAEPGPERNSLLMFAETARRTAAKILGRVARENRSPDTNVIAPPAELFQRIAAAKKKAANWRARAKDAPTEGHRIQCLLYAEMADKEAEGILDRWRRGEIDG